MELMRYVLQIAKPIAANGKNLLEQALNSILEEYLSNSMKNIIKKMMKQPPSLSLTSKEESYPHIMLCKRIRLFFCT